MTLDLDAQIEELEKNFANGLYRKFHFYVNKSRNKEFVAATLIYKYLDFYYNNFSDTDFKKYLIDTLSKYYEIGYPIGNGIEDVKLEGKSLLKEYNREENIQVKDLILQPEDIIIMKNEKTILRYFAKYTGFQIFLLYLKKGYNDLFDEMMQKIVSSVKFESGEHFLEELYSLAPFDREIPFELTTSYVKTAPSDVRPSLNPIAWKNTNETEFLQFVYSMYYAGAIDNHGQGITKLVETMAQLFSFKLSDHWQSKLSHSINRSKMDYEPAIIKTIRRGYAKLAEERTRK
jgi:hypothetical protein